MKDSDTIKRRKCITRYACIHLQTFDYPLISPATGCPLTSIRLESDRPYTIGRAKTCNFLFDDRRVSKQHCQIFYDSVRREILIVDGFVSPDIDICDLSEFRSRVICFDRLEGDGRESVGCSTVKDSLNGVFVNGVRVKRETARELCAGDEVFLVCGNEKRCSSRVRIGFMILGLSFKDEVVIGSNEIQREKPGLFYETVESIGHSQGSVSSGRRNKRVFAVREDDVLSISNDFLRAKNVDIMGKAKFLLKQCWEILQSKDPVSYMRQFYLSDCGTETAACKFAVGGEVEVNSGALVSGKEAQLCDESHLCQDFNDIKCAYAEGLKKRDSSSVDSKEAAAYNNSKISSLNSVSKTNAGGTVPMKSSKSCCPPPGKKFYLNRLQFMDCDPFSSHKCISLPELLCPIESISQLFIATFTSDIQWFLSYCEIPNNLPVTIACHNNERCWSLSPEKRISVPYSDFPNLVVVFPPFPEPIAFGGDRRRQGIACHHPKLLVIQREHSIRIIITSANLVANQWNNVTNTVWWQDFPSRSAPDHSSLFIQVSDGENQGSRSDFAAQLAGFMASLVADVPSQAHWITELTKYNFEGATGHLIASVPGIHPRKIPYHELGSCELKFLGSVEACVVGLSHRFHNSADKNGTQLKKLAAFLGKSCENSYGMLKIVLRRNTNVPADVNAVSVLVPNPDNFSEEDCIQLGFLPRYVAKWVSPLWDSGFFRFSGYVYPKEARASALGGSSMKVQLILHVLEGPKFPDMMEIMQPEHVIAFCSLIATIQRCTGIWRLQEVLDQFKWPEIEQSDLIYGCSSVGSSINAQFLASFSAAAGKRSLQRCDSEESDPEAIKDLVAWGCWSASQEMKNPSIRILFPTIERVKGACNGILPSRRILCFSEKTWERLRTADILHDAIPHPHDRVGCPMHVKVAWKRFKSKMDSSSFGWVYCGSHNFSAAAWGHLISNPFGLKSSKPAGVSSSTCSRLHICNYELGIIFTFPPETNCGANLNHASLDDIVLPFVVPAPKYGKTDRPATGRAMQEALAELREQEREVVDLTTIEDMVEEIPDEEDDVVEVTDCVVLEREEEKAYAEMLWSQVDSSQSC